MIRCCLPKDASTGCTIIPGAWLYNKKRHITKDVPASHQFFFLSSFVDYILGSLLLLLAFFDIWPLARERQDFFIFFPFEKHCLSEPGFHSFWPRCHKYTAEPQFGWKTAMIALRLVPELPVLLTLREITLWDSEDTSFGLMMVSSSESVHLPLWKMGLHFLRNKRSQVWTQWIRIPQSFSVFVFVLFFCGPVIFCVILFVPHHSVIYLNRASQFSENRSSGILTRLRSQVEKAAEAE